MRDDMRGVGIQGSHGLNQSSRKILVEEARCHSSSRSWHDSTLAPGCKGEACENVLMERLGKVREEFGLGHAAGLGGRSGYRTSRNELSARKVHTQVETLQSVRAEEGHLARTDEDDHCAGGTLAQPLSDACIWKLYCFGATRQQYSRLPHDTPGRRDDRESSRLLRGTTRDSRHAPATPPLRAP